MRTLIVIVFLFFSTIAFSQQPGLVIQGTSPNLYLNHIVAPKEGLYSIARTFNLTPKALATFNSLSIDKGLSIGQVVKIPLTEQNFDQQGKGGSDETLVDLYHVVGKNETLFRIGSNHKISPENVKQWSKLSSDNIEVGKPLVVGHLKIKNDQVAFFNESNTIIKQDVLLKQTVKAPISQTPKEEKKTVVEKPVLEGNVPVASNTPVNKSATEKTETNLPATKTEMEAKPVVTNETPKVPTTEEKKAPSNLSEKLQNKAQSLDILPASDEGAFVSLYVNNTNTAVQQNSGQAGTFKSTSGWQDKKYYVLMNNIAPGTILKITSAESKSVYAKVLGSMPEMKENNGLLLRMSNAAASYLGIIDPKFPVQISYFQ